MAQKETAGFGAVPPPAISHILCIDLEETFESLHSLPTSVGSHAWLQ